MRKQSHACKPTKHVLHEYNARKNLREIHLEKDTTTHPEKNKENLLYTFNFKFNDLTF
jgi:hypothetical protein